MRSFQKYNVRIVQRFARKAQVRTARPWKICRSQDSAFPKFLVAFIPCVVIVRIFLDENESQLQLDEGRSVRKSFVVLVLLLSVSVLAFGSDDSAESRVGERLFLETRFAQFFAANCGGDVNATLAAGDPTVATILKAPDAKLASPFAGQSMNCRVCHLVDDIAGSPGGGFRTYADFARRSPIPAREDGLTLTPRNSPSLVNTLLARPARRTLHFDAEFPTITDLIKGTLTGRNFGWLPGEQSEALKHIARVIRKDNGQGELAQQTGGPYRLVFAGDESVPEALQIGERYRLDVMKASDPEILDAIAKLMAVYVHSLEFARDDKHLFSGSPYDAFLKKNGLPQAPHGRLPDLTYARELRGKLLALSTPKYVDSGDGKFQLHDQPFQFGAQELKGLQIFLAEPLAGQTSGSVGNCIACHAPPNFTDFSFHNTGAAQEEYDAIHGVGAFNALAIPTLAERTAKFDAYLPPTGNHPHATGVFRAIPAAKDPRLTDLGVWNIFANPDVSSVAQKHILAALNVKPRTDPAQVLDRCVAAFKTPGLRDLPDSAPFLHTGRMDTLTDVLQFYRVQSGAARAGTLRNADPEIAKIQLSDEDITALNAFLLALTEDYN